MRAACGDVIHFARINLYFMAKIFKCLYIAFVMEKYFPGGMNYDELILEDDKRHFNSFEELQNFTKKITGKTFEDLEQMNAYLEEAMEAYNRENDISNENVVIIYKYAEK